MTIDFRKYKALSFDIYGTLVDWETGIYNALQPLRDRFPDESQETSCQAILGAYTIHEQDIQREQPNLLYTDVLAAVYHHLASQLNFAVDEPEAESFAASIGSWPAYPDSVAAMQTLSKHYKLIALSNVDGVSFGKTLAGPLNGVHFDAIFTAQDIGSYKPDLNNFRYLIEHVHRQFGVHKHEILHVAQSLFHDHVPAKEVGLAPGVWISRAGGEGRGSAMGGSLEKLKAEGKVELGAVFDTLGEMAEAVQKTFET